MPGIISLAAAFASGGFLGVPGALPPASPAPHPSHPSPFPAPALFYTTTNKYLLVRKQICLTKRVTKPLRGQAHTI